jgi:hypothetical protein
VIAKVLNRTETKTLIELLEKVRDGLVASETETD